MTIHDSESTDRHISLYEPDPRHVELLLEHLGLDGTKVKGVSTPGEKSGTLHDETELEKSTVTLYRSRVMRLAYLGADLPHFQFCANRLARGMSKPKCCNRVSSRIEQSVHFRAQHGTLDRLETR